MTEKEVTLNEDDFFEDDEDSQKDKYLTFRIENEDYAIEIKHVREIIRIQKITEVPDMDDYVKGVINLRGKVIPLIDVRKRFRLTHREYDDRTCIIVVNMNEILTGLIVDRVSEVLDIPETQVDPPPNTGNAEECRFIQGMGKVNEYVKIILNVDKLLNEERFNTLKEMSEASSC